MDKFTKEQQVQAVYDLKVGYTLGHADIAMLKSMDRQLLSSMGQEPEGWKFLGVNGLWVSVTENGMRQALKEGCEVRPLYAAPQLPQPAPEKIAMQNFRASMEGIGHIRRTLDETFGGLRGTHCEPDVLVECKEICDAIYEAYRKTAPVTPDGWQLVPKEPTEAMNKAGWAAMNEHDAINPTYRAMLAAAPLQAEEPAQKK